MSSSKPSGDGRGGSGQRSDALERMKAKGAGIRDAATGRAPSRPDRAPSTSPRTGTAARNAAPSASPRTSGPRPASAGRPAGQGGSGQGSGSQASGGREAATRPAPKLVRPPQRTKVRRARLLVSKVDPWSVLKMAFLLSVALGIVTVVASIVLWTVLDLTGIFARINQMLGEVGGSNSFDLRTYASLGQVASFATVVAVTNIFLLTALSVLAAVLYNITSTLVGGIGVTLTDD
ncbi:hypothetical protein GCM10011512_01930 [Tersicoccus solisilvae]|uniref:DUF3566 domain-containing protein n=1 Tax=Tersicoccus solisilvae TaxID=1882339 RepID=A0ABQ1NK05_9MICC|nr:DUF3566 domain-containing protein [Tersicoccus solisilvae]GGC78915.1 hypothetical protein GCM10011512_01930 [Tersicoccus solisilvae]